MKKLFIAIAVVCACALSSCTNPDVAQCWELTFIYPGGATATYYVWADGPTIEQYQKECAILGINTTRSSTFKGQGDRGTMPAIK